MKKIAISYAGVIAILAGLWYLLLISPLANQRRDCENRIQQAQTQVAALKANLTELPISMKLHQTLGTLKTKMQSRLYAREDILGLFEYLETEANARNLELVEISPPVEELLRLNRIPAHSDQARYLNITLKLQGGFVDFGKYVGIVEQAGFFRGVNSCRVMSQSEPESKLFLQLAFRALLNDPETAS